MLNLKKNSWVVQSAVQIGMSTTVATQDSKVRQFFLLGSESRIQHLGLCHSGHLYI